MKAGRGLAGIFFLILVFWIFPLQADPPSWKTFVSLALKADDLKTFGEADALLQRLRVSGQEPDPAHSLRLVWGLVRLAEFYLRQDHMQEAERCQTEALRLLEARGGSEELPLLVAPLHGLARIWLAQGHVSQARHVLERALDIVETTQEPHPLLAIRFLEQLADIHMVQGDPQGALRLHQHIATLQEHALAPNTPGYAIILARLAKQYHQGGQDAEAAPLFRKAKEILMQTSGPYHAARVEILAHLASFAEGNLPHNRVTPEQAIKFLKQALAISENMEGAHHPDLVPILKKLAKHYQEMGKPDQSRPLLMRAAALVEKLYGSDHDKTAEAMLALAENLRMEQQLEPALTLYNRALVIFRHVDPAVTTPADPALSGDADPSVSGDADPSVSALTGGMPPPSRQRGLAHTLMGLAKTLQAQGKSVAAERNHREALEIIKKTLGRDHPEYLVARGYHAELTAEMEKQTGTTRLGALDFLRHVRIMHARLLTLGHEVGSTEDPPGTQTTLHLMERRFGLPPSEEIVGEVLEEILPHQPTLLPVRVVKERKEGPEIVPRERPSGAWVAPPPRPF